MTWSRSRFARLGCLLVAILTTAVVVIAGLPAQAEVPTKNVPILVVLDTSGSMADDSGTSLGGSKLGAARGAVLDLVQALGSGHQYGMISYPGGKDDGNGCSIGTVQTELGALNIPKASADARRMRADGGTPTAAALEHGARVLSESGSGGRGVIVLVSDGESNCGPDPCEIANQIRGQGSDVVVNTVGFQLSEEGEDQLRCVADATGGRYVRVDDPDGLAATLQDVSQASLTLEVEAPDVFRAVTGTGASGSTSVAVKVGNTGRVKAQDVRITLSFASPDDQPGRVLVPEPVFYLGGLATGTTQAGTFAVRPDRASAGPAKMQVVVTADNAASVKLTRDITVSAEISRAALGPVFDGVERIVVMGDSYSSGEGAGSYSSGSDGKENNCHRSAKTYGKQLWGERAMVIACSGAVTADFFSPQDSKGKSVTPQILALEKALKGPEPPQAVLLSIGGNDAGFLYAGLACGVGRGNCLQSAIVPTGPFELSDLRTVFMNRALAVGPDVSRVLRSVNAAINSPARVRERGFVAPIVVVPYPRIIPESFEDVDSQSGCMLGFSGAELDFLNAFFNTLDASVAVAALQLHNAGEPIYYAGDVQNAFLPDHTICEGDAAAWANFLSYDEHLRLQRLSPADLQRKLTDYVELLHPNAAGHEAMAQALVNWSTGPSAKPYGLPPGYAAPVGEPGKQKPPGLSVTHPKVLSSRFGAAGGWVWVEADGFAAGSQVVCEINSTPIVIGTAQADDAGNVGFWARLPSDTPYGSHRLVSYGYTAEGAVRISAASIRVVGWGGAWLLPVGILAVAMIGSGLVWLAVERLRSLASVDGEPVDEGRADQA